MSWSGPRKGSEGSEGRAPKVDPAYNSQSLPKHDIVAADVLRRSGRRSCDSSELSIDGSSKVRLLVNKNAHVTGLSQEVHPSAPTRSSTSWKHDTHRFGPQHALDSGTDAAWKSAPSEGGEPSYYEVAFGRSVEVRDLRIMFQGTNKIFEGVSRGVSLIISLERLRRRGIRRRGLHCIYEDD